MAFMLGAFTSGLFSGVQSVFELREKYDKLQDKKKLNEAADAASAAMKEDAASADKGTAKVSTIEAPSTKTSTFLDDPDLQSIQPPTYMSGAMKSASAADAGRATPASTAPPEYLSPAMKSATAADAPKQAMPTDTIEPGPSPMTPHGFGYMLGQKAVGAIQGITREGVASAMAPGLGLRIPQQPTAMPQQPAQPLTVIPSRPTAPTAPAAPQQFIEPPAARPPIGPQTMIGGGLGAQILRALDPYGQA